MTSSPLLHWASYLLLLGSVIVVGAMAWSYKQDAVRAAEELENTTGRLDTANQVLWDALVGLDGDIGQLWAAVFGDDGRDEDGPPAAGLEDTARSHPVDSYARQQWLLADPARYGRHARPASDPAD